MGFGAAVSSGFRQYAKLSGRASRSEYWWWGVFAVLVGIIAAIAGAVLSVTTGSRLPDEIIHGASTLALLLPNIAISVRRLHDLNRSGWWLSASFILIFFILALGVPVGIRMAENYHGGLSLTDGLPLAGFVVIAALVMAEGVVSLLLVFWYCMRGTKGANRFGADPLRAV